MIERQIDTLLKMKDGWLRGYGKAPAKENLLWFQEAFLQNYDQSLPCPSIYPTIFGSIQLEWNINTLLIVLGVTFKSKTCYVRCTNAEGKHVSNTDFDLQNANAWRSICKIIKNAKDDEQACLPSE